MLVLFTAMAASWQSRQSAMKSVAYWRSMPKCRCSVLIIPYARSWPEFINSIQKMLWLGLPNRRQFKILKIELRWLGDSAGGIISAVVARTAAAYAGVQPLIYPVVDRFSAIHRSCL
jgi:hypothetical protein